MTLRIVAVLFVCIVLLGISGCRSQSQKPKDQTSRHASALERELISAALQGNAKRMEVALNAGADVNAFDNALGSPLGGASYSGNLEAVRLLTDRGADVNRKDNEGMTPLMNATLSGNADVLQLLLSKGADVNAASPRVVDGRKTIVTALTLAKGSRRNQIVTLLIQAGAKE